MAQPIDHLPAHFADHRRVGGREAVALGGGHQRTEPVERLIDGQPSEGGETHTGHGHRARIGPQAVAATVDARHGPHQRLQRSGAMIRVLAFVLLEDEAPEPRPRRLEPMHAGPRAATVAPFDLVHTVLARAVEGDPPCDVVQVGEWRREVDADRPADGLERGHVPPVGIAVEAARTVAGHGAATQRPVGVGDEAGRIALDGEPQPLAGRARTRLGVG